jgi:hypothetical protein
LKDSHSRLIELIIFLLTLTAIEKSLMGHPNLMVIKLRLINRQR